VTRRRRAPGDGTITRLPSGSFRARWRDKGGTEHGRTFPTRTEALDHLAAVRSDRRRGVSTDPRSGRQRLETFWARYLARSDLRPATRAQYEVMGRRYILPALGDHQLAAITRRDVADLLARLGAGGTGAPTIAAVHRILRAVLSEAVREEAIAANPASRVRAPTVEATARRFLSADELESIAAAVEPRYRALVLLLGYGGLRFGEAAALRVKDLDLLRRRVAVSKALVEVRGEAMEGPTKTSRVRSVAIPERVSAELPSHIDAFAAGPDGRLFTSPEGGPLRGANFRRRVWFPAIAAASIEPPAPRVHDLRHTAASLAIQGGAHPKAVQELLGHASIAVTFDVYAHLFDSLADDVAVRVDELARAAAESVASRPRHEPVETVTELRSVESSNP